MSTSGFLIFLITSLVPKNSLYFCNNLPRLVYLLCTAGHIAPPPPPALYQKHKKGPKAGMEVTSGLTGTGLVSFLRSGTLWQSVKLIYKYILWTLFENGRTNVYQKLFCKKVISLLAFLKIYFYIYFESSK